MCLEAKNQKPKTDWFICTLRSSKNVDVRFLLDSEINKFLAKLFQACV